MLMEPKGIKYWIEDDRGNLIIDPNAPDWAKEEFEEYQKLMDKQYMPDEKGNLISF